MIVQDDLNAVELKHKRRVWRPFMEKYNLQVICELGVFNGENFMKMIEHNPKVAVAVDSWIVDGNVARADSGYPQEQLNDQYEKFVKMIADKPFAHLYREYTFEAVKNFPDEYFDLIYIDADHTYEGCKKDLEDWWPKMKKGGFFTGDDYSHSIAKFTGVKFGVVEAVNEFAAKHNLQVYELTSHGWMLIKA
jgi:hypothetical protein